MENIDVNQVERRRRRRKKRLDEESIDSVSTVSKVVDDHDRNRDFKEDDKTSSVDELDVKKRRKKLKKIKESSKDETEDGSIIKPRKKKKKKQQGSISSSEDNTGGDVDKKSRKKRQKRDRISESQTYLLKEDFYSDPQLASTLQGLEDDMYSVTGEADTGSILSPYPLLPSNIPPSQPVAKIYLEKNGGGFAKTSVSTPVVASNQFPTSPTPQLSPLGLGLVTQRVFRSFATFCHGFLAGLAAWQVFTIYILHKDDLEFVEMYSPLSQPLMIVFYLLTIICTVSVCDRYDISEMTLSHLKQCLTLQSGGVSVLVYWATLLLTLVTTKVDDKLSLFQHNSSLFEKMQPEQLSYELETWKAMNLARSISVVFGWFIISIRPSTDLLYKHLKRLNSSDKIKANKIETVKMA